MSTLRHRTFVGPTFYTAGGSLNENREAIRSQAQAFVNGIGLENVVSICEHAMTFGPFSVVVWYRGDAAGDDNPVVVVSNAVIARELQAARGQPAAWAPPTPKQPISWWWVWWLVFLSALGLSQLVQP
jgi:hypothetical protein